MILILLKHILSLSFQVMLGLLEIYQHGDVSLHGTLAFDKDDELSMRFVCAASNLRSKVFGIDILSFHHCKGIAGNIIPAIATTNAIVAGIQVLAAVKYITSSCSEDKALRKSCPPTYVIRYPTRRGNYLYPTTVETAAESCYVCNSNQLVLEIDTNLTTLEVLLKKVIKTKLGFNLPSISLGHSGLYEEGDGADVALQSNLSLFLSKCPGGGVHEGSVLSIEDFSQDLEVNILIKHVEDSEFDDEETPDHYVLSGQGESLQRKQKSAVVIESDSSKRARDEDDIVDASAKKAKTDDLLLLDETDGVICLD